MFIEQQFFAQHEYYQKNYIGAKFYIIEKENTTIGRLYIDFFFENKGIRIIDITLLPDWRKKKYWQFYFGRNNKKGHKSE